MCTVQASLKPTIRSSLSSRRKRKFAIRFLFSPTSQRTLMPSCTVDQSAIYPGGASSWHMLSDLGFRFFHLLVIVSLQLHQWAEHVLVMVPVFVDLEHWIDLGKIKKAKSTRAMYRPATTTNLVINARAVKILERGIWIGLPELFQLRNLGARDLASTQLLLLRGDFHEPGQERSVLDDGLPHAQIPHLFQCTDPKAVPAEKDHD